MVSFAKLSFEISCGDQIGVVALGCVVLHHSDGNVFGLWTCAWESFTVDCWMCVVVVVLMRLFVISIVKQNLRFRFTGKLYL